MRKVSKVLAVFLICVLLMSAITYAVDLKPNFGGEASTISGIATKFLGVIQWIGYAIAIGMLIYAGIKYVTTSAEGKADMKSALVKYVIGAILIGGASGITTIILTMFGDTYK